MVKDEITGRRDLTYSLWHRTIGDVFYMIDLDCVEWRGERGIVAFIEIARFDPKEKTKMCDVLTRKQAELKILDELQNKTQVPAYLVLYTPTLSTFWIFKIENRKPIFWKAENKDEYADFIRGL